MIEPPRRQARKGSLEMASKAAREPGPGRFLSFGLGELGVLAVETSLDALPRDDLP